MRSNPRTDGLRASDAEITRPQNEGPFEAPESPPSWHVHLELHPEELVTLHRMGFTSGALAWREGMRDWQPLALGAPPPLAPPPPRTENSVSNVPMALVRRRTPPPLERETPPERESSPERSGPKERSGTSERSGAGRTTEDLAPRLQAFSRRTRSIPPLASPMAVPVIGVPPRPNLELLPPPPPIERLAGPEAWDAAAHVSSHTDLPRLSDSAIREIKPPSLPPPPVELPNRPLRPGSRALWLGAAALVALSASNGALVSALLWSLRHSASASVAALSRSFNASMCPAPTSATTPAKPAALAAAPAAAAVLTPPAPADAPAPPKKREGPVSIDELPLASDPTKPSETSRTASKSSKSTSDVHASSTRSAASSGRASRGKSSRVVLAEEPANKRTAPAPASDGQPDRESMNKALMLASASASTCSDGPEKGRVAVTFSPSGSVQGVRLVQSFGDASINSCVLRAMGRAHVTPFTGDPITVTKTLSW
ncbi:MAG: hypothetical protein ACOY0T_21885 [Myxococcota bacterium]